MTTENEPVPPRALTEAEQRIVSADNAFGLSLFRSVHESDPEANLFLSPLSVSMALGMTLNGADGDTREEMIDVLKKNNLTEASINESYASLIRLLSGLDDKVILNIANSIWYREGFSVEAPFLEKNRTYFDAEVEALDFSAPDAPAIINSWVDEKTNGLIDKIIDQIGEQVVMYLINAIYFKGIWTYQFDSEQTTDAPFNNLVGPPSTVRMMSIRGTFPYFRSEEAAYIDIPYGDSLYSMTIILPHDTGNLDNITADLDDEAWSTIEERLDHTTVDLFMPSFSLEYKTSLREILISLGMQKAFVPNEADFSRINPNRELFISEVLHKTFVEVTEEGTEAAAVTAVVIETTSIGENDPPVFRIDKPFLFSIREKSTGTILFIGKITQL